MSYSIQGLLEWAKHYTELANSYGLPIPLTIIVMALAWSKNCQARWTVREKFYIDVLYNLEKWRNALTDMLHYYEEPGSEHDDSCTETEGFKNLQKKAHEASEVIRDLRGRAAIYLSKQTIDTLRQVENDDYSNTAYGAVCMAEYLSEANKYVEKAYNSVLQNARSDLGKSRLAETILLVEKGSKS